MHESRPAPGAPQLTVVMPVHNERSSIGDVVREWTGELGRLGIDFRLAVYDDGSTDDTPSILRELAQGQDRLSVVSQPNRGHGPTILRGYREAASEWVFQVDSDGEMGAGSFSLLWERRADHDFLLGYREDRRESLARWLVTGVSRLTVRALFGTGIRDVNTPYRLMRRSALEPLLARLPPDSFAPNVILSGLAVAAGLRIYEAAIPHQERQFGRGSLTSLKLWKAAVRSFRQTVQAAVRARGHSAR